MKRLLSIIGLIAGLAACEPVSVVSDAIEGPRTKHADVFAKAFLDKMQARSFSANREFCGLFGRDAEGYVIATPPIVGMLDSCRPPEIPGNFNVFASYHSHGAFDLDVDTEVPSSNDVIADLQENLIGYISTPGGRVWRNENGVAVQLCGRGCLTTDPNFRPEIYGPIALRYTIAQLIAREGRY